MIQAAPDQEWAELRSGFSEYVRSLSPCSQETGDGYAEKAGSFAAWCRRRGLSLLAIGAEDVREYVDPRDPATATALRWLFRLLVSRGLRRDNPMSRPAYVQAQYPSELSQDWANDFRLFTDSLALAVRTVRQYLYDAAFFRRWCRDNAVDSERAEQADIGRYLEGLRGHMGQSARVRRFAGLRCYHQWLLRRGVRPDDPTEGIRLKQPSHPPKEPFSRDELDRLLATCRKAQERAVLLLLMDTGLRLGEITGLRFPDVDFERETMRVHGKGDKERMIAASPRTLQALRLCMDGRDYPWYSQRRHGPMTNDGLFRLIKRVGRRAGVANVHPHRFRTTFAILFDTAGGSLQALQLLMGHSKIEQTAHYTRWGAEQRALDTQRRFLAEGRL